MSEHNPSCSTRRTVLRAGLGIAAAAAAMGSAAAQSTPKLAKNIVMYQDQPKNGQQCSMCVNFQPPNACKIVDGEISPNGWCGAFAPKPA